MSYVNSDALVSTEWLAAHLSAPDVRVVDASWYPATAGIDPRAQYEERHIPGAVFFSIDQISDSNNPAPHMLPEAAKFASKVRKLGLGNGNKVVIYDHAGGGAAAARAWWMFRVFGHNDVAILEGGMEKWLQEGRPTEDLPPMPRERHFMPRVNQLLVRDKAQLLANLDSKKETVIDARTAGRFAGVDPEPWPVAKTGHIPGAVNLPWGKLLKDDKTFRPAEELSALFAGIGVDPSQPLVASCGSGVTACVLALGLYLLGNKDVAVYDGSWAEWGKADDTPVEQ